MGDSLKNTSAIEGSAALQSVPNVVTSVKKIESQEEKLSWKDFLEKAPPNSKRTIRPFATEGYATHSAGKVWQIKWPTLWMYCPSPSCQSEKFFDAEYGIESMKDGQSKFTFETFTCRHCKQYKKTFSLLLEGKQSGEVVKLGESPPFAPHTPSKLKHLVESDRDRYMKGRMAESYGLGVGAFAYYRQVVENIKTQLFTEIIKVVGLRPGNEKLIKELEAAKKEGQFSKAVGKIKRVLPDVLLYKGHSPLLLLHSALSENLHEGSDESCLKLAQNIRIVLSDLAERISFALKEESSLDEAFSELMKGHASSKPKRKKIKATLQDV